ncbi:RidA family protein [Gemmatimonas sp.]|uniref:RidA family protein n=1 Tax=Gemmatimonas sp. TaxID=1962908 RepID=UPI0022CAD668|nr:RidA family protein [Gemmatimonas sp.]MCZ8203194.1 RidA family protein [Gemmatimonas sp.]
MISRLSPRPVRAAVRPSRCRLSAVTLTALLATALVMTACTAPRPTPAPEPVFIHPDGPPVNPFSPAVRVGDLVFVSGTLGTTGTGLTLVPGGIQPETRQVMENIKRTLAAAGLGMDRLVKCTAYLADLTEWPAMNEVYRSYFTNGRFPARAAVQATLLNGARVELECIAAAR